MIKHLLAVLLLALAVTHAPAQPLADQVPGDALVYVGWRGADDPGLGYVGSNLWAVGGTDELPAALSQTLDLIQQANGQDRWAGLVVQMVRSIGAASWHHPTAAYLQKTDDMNFPVRFTVLWQAEGEEGDLLVASLQQLVSELPPDAPLTIKQTPGLVSLTIAPPAPGSDDVAPFENKVSVAPLAQAQGFTRAMAQVDANGAMVVYLDARGLLGLIDSLAETESPREQEQWLKVRSALGLEGLNGLAISGGFDGKDWRCDLFIDAPAPRTGLLTLLDGEPISDAELMAIPIEATWLAAGRLDLGALLDEVRRVAGEIDPNAVQQLEDALLQGNQMTGIDIEGDLIRALGSSWIFYTDPGSIGSGIMGLCMVNSLKDPEAAERSLVSLQALANALMGQAGARAGMRIRFHASDDHGMRLNTLGVPFVAPTWSVHDGKLYVGLYPQTVMTAGDRTRAGGPTILDSERFKAVMDRLNAGGKGASSIVYTDLPRTAKDSYQNMVMLTQMGTGFLAMFGGDNVPALLPPYARIEPLLSASGQVDWTDDAGYHSRSISPFPGSVFLGPQGSMNSMSVAPMMAGITLPALGAARRSARQMKGVTQCRGIVQAQITFAMGENKERLSNDIGQLIERNYFSYEYAISPNSGISPPRGYRGWDIEQQKQWVRENASYVLIPDLKAEINSETVAVFERPDHSSGAGIAVGFNDGSARFMNEWEAREMIEAQTGKTLEELIERQQNYQPPVDTDTEAVQP